MTDRRRVNAPSGGTKPPVFAPLPFSKGSTVWHRPTRQRQSNELRKTFLKTGLTPSASGSAYLELESPLPSDPSKSSLLPSTSALKLTCAVHGPKPLPRSAPFTPNVLLSTHIKFSPFAGRHRRGYIRDFTERDLAVNLETALRGVIIGDRWPKSGVEVVITVLEGEEDHWWGDESVRGSSGLSGCGMMNILAGCITVASAAIIDAGIDCVDLISGGVAAVVSSEGEGHDTSQSKTKIKSGLGKRQQIMLDPSPSDHEFISAACVVGFLPTRQEITELWVKGDLSGDQTRIMTNGSTSQSLFDELVDGAIGAALGIGAVLGEAVKEAAVHKAKRQGVDFEPTSDPRQVAEPRDTEMRG
ncbi:MAG: Mannan polymerase II complex anp1 subunit [Chaenotheca gracillima]|nr:MAG: Mannan polymerase II complex anp1 subunit [Chaenotheca gracillima]